MKKAHRPLFQVMRLSREAQLFVGWVSGSVTHAGVGFHASTQPTFILYLIPPTHLIFLISRVGLGEFAIIWDIVAAKNLGVKS